MKYKTWLVNSLIIVSLPIFIGGIVYLISNFVIGEYNPSWTHDQLQPAPKEIVDIAHIEINSNLDDPTGDIVYITDKYGIVYSNTIFQNKWETVDPIPNWENDFNISNCTKERLGPNASHIWDNPPIEKGVIDSAGVLFERPISIIVRCYVLLDDGNLEVWVHSEDAMSLMKVEGPKILFTILGAILGIITGLVIVLFRIRT